MYDNSSLASCIEKCKKKYSTFNRTKKKLEKVDQAKKTLTLEDYLVSSNQIGSRFPFGFLFKIITHARRQMLRVIEL